MLRLSGNFPAKSFLPAHINPNFDVFSFADVVIAILFPALGEHEAILTERMKEVDNMKTRAPSVRKEEHLLDREKFTKSLRLSCRVTLCCLVARPRSWQQWTIIETEPTLWERAADPANRVIRYLFVGNQAAIDAMNRLAVAVRSSEEAGVACPALFPQSSPHTYTQQC